MEKTLFIISIIVLSANYIYGQTYDWVIVNPGGITGTPGLSDLSFIDDHTGWISSNTADSVFYTVDGATFTPQSIGSTIMGIYMIDGNTGYAASDDGSLYRTTDGGTNWNYLASTFATLNDITFPRTGSTDTGYACGDNGAIFSVTSSGATAMTSGVVSNLKSITFPTATEGWACGQSVILHFASGAWQGDQAYPSGTYNAIYFIDNQKGWAIGTRIIHTSDGQTWVEQTNPDTLGRTLVSIFFLNENEGWIVGNQGLILHTTNGGTTWNIEGNGLTSALLRGVQFTSSTNGYVVGNNKTLLKYAQISGVPESERYPGLKIYPNPTSRKIRLEIPDNQQVESAVIRDMTGRECIRKDHVFTPEMDLESLHPGFYSIQIVANKQRYAGKILKQ